jgi:polyphenol oxidase
MWPNGFFHYFGSRADEGWQETWPHAKLRQTHSVDVVDVEVAGEAGEGDALITRQSGLLLTIRTADCVPILIADPVQRAVAAIHSGWKGTAGNITGATVARMQQTFGSRPEDLIALAGPAIQVCCFEVGPEVAVHFGREERCCVDLAAEVSRQLLAAGLPASNFRTEAPCTRCDERYPSYRRDREKAGRMVSGAALFA